MQETLKIILKEKEFEITSDFRYFNDIDPDVRLMLLTNKKYVVKSDVQEEILDSFINFWINKEIPEFTLYNLSEYEQLSQEFDLMKEVILVYKRSLEQIQNKETQTQQQNFEFEERESKLKRIINILLNKPFNHELKSQIIDAIQEEDIDKINFYSQETVYNYPLLYIINNNDQTARVILCDQAIFSIEIPRTIYHFCVQFPVITIHEKTFKNHQKIQNVTFSIHSKLCDIQNSAFECSTIQTIVIPKSVKKIGNRAFSFCFNLVTVEFENDSELNYIGESAFECCSITSLSLPSNHIEFKENWCYYTQYLNNIKVLPTKEKCICLYENQFLLMKSDPKSDVFDILLLAPRDIKRAIIPPFIRKISPCAFSCCRKLELIECLNDSNLRIIGSNAFNNSSIQKLIIPSCVESFEYEWCSETLALSEVIILPTEIQNIMLYKDQIILGKSDLSSENFDVIYFACRDIEDVVIPSFIKEIRSNAFDGCLLENIIFSENSELFSIEQSAFQRSGLKKISIPYRITKISEKAFADCENLEQIEIPINSEIREFGASSLCSTSIKSLYIPSKVVSFKPAWCECTQLLYDISISPSNKNFIYLDNKYIVGKSDPFSSNYDVLVFSRRDIRISIIPSFINKLEIMPLIIVMILKRLFFQRIQNYQLLMKMLFLALQSVELNFLQV